MLTLRTAGELRGFLADVLVGVKDGTIDTNKANAIAKVSAQINQSLSVEVNTALQLEKMGGGRPVAGSMVIAERAELDEAQDIAPIALEPTKPTAVIAAKPLGAKTWCEQCDQNVSAKTAENCSSAFCKARGA